MMLSLLMMLASDPLTAETTDGLKARLRGIRQPKCHNGAVIRTGDGTTIMRMADRPLVWPGAPRLAPEPASVAANDLMFRSGDPVQMTLLLERTVNHCSVPISTELSAAGRALLRFGNEN